MANKAGTNFNTPSGFNTAVLISLRDEQNLAILGTFTGSVPTDADEFQVGCMLIKTDASGTAGVFTNQGTAASPSFVELT